MDRTNILLFVVLVVSAVGWPAGGEDIPEECRPKPPQSGKEGKVCCEIPSSKEDDMFESFLEECKEKVKSEHPEVLPSAGGSLPPPHHKGLHLMMICIEECVFNKAGLMVDNKLDQEAVTKKVDFFAPDSTWKSVALEATKICYEKSKETKVDDKEGKCSPIPSKFAKCMIRQMYLKCPSDKWQNNDECNAEKQLFEKCPNLMPFHAMKKKD